MPFQILVNLAIAALWMFLQDEWSFLAFTSGYLVGLLVTFGLRRFFKKEIYLKKLYSALKLLILFIHELIISSLLLIRQVLRPRLNVTPGIFRLETDLEEEWEVTLLALLISLTPGSMVIEVAPAGNVLYVHAMDIPESRDFVIQTKNRFERAIKEVGG